LSSRSVDGSYRLRRAGPLALGASFALLLTASCRSPTQIVLRVHTNVPCTADNPWQGVAVYVGKPGRDVEETSATLVTTTCDDSGSVGSLVVVPSGDNDDVVGLRVVAGVKRNPEQCEEAAYNGCIVARRSVRFTPHDTLELEVELAQDCVSVGCDPERTCIEGGCVVSERVAPAPEPEPEPEGASVYCGPDVRCPTTGNVCCLHVDPNSDAIQGSCRPSQDCPPEDIVLNCDDDTDCPAVDPVTGTAGVCAVSYTQGDSVSQWIPQSVSSSACRFQNTGSLQSHWGLGLCQTRGRCANSDAICQESDGYLKKPLPHYFWCRLDGVPDLPEVP
jgi:hypothetical protein